MRERRVPEGSRKVPGTYSGRACESKKRRVPEDSRKVPGRSPGKMQTRNGKMILRAGVPACQHVFQQRRRAEKRWLSQGPRKYICQMPAQRTPVRFHTGFIPVSYPSRPDQALPVLALMPAAGFIPPVSYSGLAACGFIPRFHTGFIPPVSYPGFIPVSYRTEKTGGFIPPK